MKLVSTKTLKRLNDLSIAEDYNRTLNQRFFREVDPEGIHVLSVLALLGDEDMYVRASGLAKMKDKPKEEPVEFLLDVPLEEWNNLAESPTAQQMEELKATGRLGEVIVS